ncbi:MAG: leucine-rich repeat domain-containing protein [archaeon]|nr:leucine-rich repeat domain-containing protein [archaeon]
MFSGMGNDGFNAVGVLKKLALLFAVIAIVSTVLVLDDSDDSDAAVMVLGQGTTKGVDWVLDSDGVISLGSTASPDVKKYSSWKSVPNAPRSFKVSIGSSVTAIPDSMFFNERITSVTFPSTLKTIGSYSFANTDLTSVVLPSTITSIKEGAFARCSQLSYVSINVSLDLGSYVFSDCPKLTKFNGSSSCIYNQTMYIYRGSLCAYATGCTDKVVSLPSDVRWVGGGIFTGCRYLEELVIPEGVTTLAGSLVNSNENIRSISFPTTLSSIRGSIMSLYEFRGPDGTVYSTNPADYAGKDFVFRNGHFEELFSASVMTDGMTCTFGPGEDRYYRFVAPASGNYAFFTSGEVDTKCYLYDSTGSVIDHEDDVSEGILNFLVVGYLQKGKAYYCHVSVYGYGSGTFGLYCKQMPDGSPYGLAGTAAFYVLAKDGTLYVAGDGTAGAPVNLTKNSVKRIVFLPGVTKVADRAFYDYDYVQTLDLGDLVHIGAYAFCRGDSLTDVVIGPKTLTVGERAFEYCTSLKTLLVKGGNLGQMAFNSCEALTDVSFTGNTDVLGAGCFNNCTSLTRITLPSLLREVSNHLFYGSGLTSVELPRNVTSIGHSSFDGCTKLTSITFNAALKSIGGYAFMDTALKTLLFPATLESLGYNVFAGIKTLESVDVAASNTVFSSLDGVLYNKDRTTLVYYPSAHGYTGFTVPSTVKTVESYAFECTDLYNVTIAGNVEKVGSYLFRDSSNLSYVTFGGKVATIGDEILEGCSKIRRITFPDGLETLGALHGYVFRDILGQTLYVTEDNLRGTVFEGSGMILRAVTENFNGFRLGLKDGVLTISGNGVYTVDYSRSVPVVYGRADEVTEVRILDGITGMGYKALKGFGNLTKLTVAATVTGLDGTFVYDCPRLTQFAVEEGGNYTVVADVLYDNDVTRLVRAPTYIRGIVVDVPATVTEICDGAFMQTTGSFAVDAHNSALVRIGKEAFKDAEVAYLLVPETLDHIGPYAYDAKFMTFFNIPAGVTETAYAFGSQVFYDYVDGMRIYPDVRGHQYCQISGTDNYTVDGTCGGVRWYVDLDDFATHMVGNGDMPDVSDRVNAPWATASGLGDSIVVEEGITGICDNAFKAFYRVKTVHLPSTLETIGKNAFTVPRGFDTVAFPAGLRSVDPDAFDAVFYDIDGSRLEMGAEFLAGYTFKKVDGKVTRQMTDPCRITLEVWGTLKDVYVDKGRPLYISEYLENDVYVRGWYYDTALTRPFVNGTVVDADMVLYADAVTVLASGTVGEDVRYMLGGDHVLTLIGHGETYGYTAADLVPWAPYAYDIREVHLSAGITSVGDRLFQNLTEVKEIVLPDSVTVIGNYAFKHDINLVSVTYSDRVSNIRTEAFAGCSSLVSLKIPAYLSSIGSNAFIGCTSLERFEGPAGLVKDSISFITYQGTLVAVATGKVDTVVLPEGTVAILPNVFTNEGNVQKITFPAGLDTILSGAFPNMVFRDEGGNLLEFTASNLAGHTFVRTGPWDMVMKDHPDTCEVVFDMAGVAFSVTVAYGSVLDIPDIVPVKEMVGDKAYVFVGWDGDYYGTTVTRDMVITALFEEVPVHTVDILYDDGTSESVRVGEGSTLEGLRPVYRYYTDTDMTAVWPADRGVDRDMVLYAAVAIEGDIEGIHWYLDTGSGVFTVTGKGDMPEFAKASAAPWYAQRGKITSIVIAGEVTSVGTNAFNAYAKVKNIQIGDNVVSVGKYAFKNCSALETLWVGNGLETMSAVAFNNKFLGPNYETVKVNADNFRGKMFEKWPQMENTLSMTSIVGSTGDVTWNLDVMDGVLFIRGEGSMGTYSGPTVTPWYQYRNNIRDVVVEEGVTDLCDFAFYSYSTLKSVELADSVATIGKNSIRGCSELSFLSFGKGLTTIGSNALYGYTFYDEDGNQLKITASKLKGKMFTGEGDKVFREGSGYNPEPPFYLYVYLDGKWYSHYLLEDTYPALPFEPEGIWTEDFYLEPYVVYGYTVGDPVKHDVYCDIFYNYIPRSELVVEGILDSGIVWSVDKVSRFLSVYGVGVTTAVMEDWSSASATPWYAYRDSIEAVYVGIGISNIGQYAFSGLYNLYAVTISDGVQTIGKRAFYHDYSITDMYLGENVSKIGTGAFSGLSFRLYGDVPVAVEALAGATLTGHNRVLYCDYLYGYGEDYGWTYDKGSLMVYGEIPDFESTTGAPWSLLKNGVYELLLEKCSRIGEKAFYNFSEVRGLIVPDTVRSIGSYAFKGCTGMLHVIFGSGLEYVSTLAFSQTFVRYDGSYLAVTPENLADRVFANDDGKMVLISIGGRDQSAWWTVDFSEESLTVTGNGAMDNASSVKNVPWYQYRGSISKVVIRDGVTNLTDYAFYSYTSLKEVTVGEGVTYIGVNAFRGCTALEKVTFGSGLTTLGSNAFYGFTFVDMDGNVVKATASNLAGHTFEGKDKVLTMVA